MSWLSLVAGLVLMLAGAGIRAGVIPLAPAGGPSGEPGQSFGPAGGGSGDSAEPTISVDPDLWFADAFDTVAAWPTGSQGSLELAYVDGRYRVTGAAADLPEYVIATTGGATPGPDVSVEAVVTVVDGMAAGGSGFGLEASDGAGTRLAVLIDAGGHVALLRDSTESLDLLASGTVPPSSGSRLVRLVFSAEGLAVYVDEALVTSTTEALLPAEFGLAVWPTDPSTVFWADDYRVIIQP